MFWHCATAIITEVHSLLSVSALAASDIVILLLLQILLPATAHSQHCNMTLTQFRTLVTTNWLRDQLFALSSLSKQPRLRVLDASATMDSLMDGYKEFYLQLVLHATVVILYISQT